MIEMQARTIPREFSKQASIPEHGGDLSVMGLKENQKIRPDSVLIRCPARMPVRA
jgi:S-adenosylmethionine synthetase